MSSSTPPLVIRRQKSRLTDLLEATWGADPLEQYGGFRQLEFDKDSSFPSSLGRNGTIGWDLCRAEVSRPSDLVMEISLHACFPLVDFDSLQYTYGWASKQWQGWARGFLTLHGEYSQPLLLYTDNILEVLVVSQLYF